MASTGARPPRSGRRSMMPSSVVCTCTLERRTGRIRSRSVPCPRALRARVGQRHSPRRVHAAAEWRVQHDANGSDLVAEMLEHERRVVGHEPRDGALLAHVLDERLRRRRVGAIASREHRERRSSGANRGELRRSSPTRWLRWDERAMYSPCQNGIRAGAPGAGVTMTRSCSIAAIRQVVEPSWKTSPTRDSCTNSSSSSPSRVRSGRLTV